MSRKDEILGALDTALRERMPADNTALHAALAQFKQEQYQAPVRIAPVRRWLALGGGTVLAGAAALGIFMVRVPEPSHLPRPRASPPPLPREERTAREEQLSCLSREFGKIIMEI